MRGGKRHQLSRSMASSIHFQSTSENVNRSTDSAQKNWKVNSDF
jgi:hypothetical protein